MSEAYMRRRPAGNGTPSEELEGQASLFQQSTSAVGHDDGTPRHVDAEDLDGRTLADRGARAALHNTPHGSRRHAEQCLDELISSGRPFTAEDLRRRMGGAVLGATVNALPALFRAAAREGRIVAVGVESARRPQARGRLLRVWQGVSS